MYIILALQGWGPLCVQTWYSGCNQWLVVFVSLLWSWTGVWTGVPNKVASQCPCCWYNFFLARLFIESMESMSATWSSRTDMWWRHLIGWIQASNHASNYILFSGEPRLLVSLWGTFQFVISDDLSQCTLSLTLRGSSKSWLLCSSNQTYSCCCLMSRRRNTNKAPFFLWMIAPLEWDRIP